jgi:hypothetical protein
MQMTGGISRRGFLRMVVQAGGGVLAAVAMPMRLAAKTRAGARPGQLEAGGYGEGFYGMADYPALRDAGIYLPMIAKE